MDDYVEVKLALAPEDAAKLVDLAGGKNQVDQYAAELIQQLYADEQDSNEESESEQSITDTHLLVDLYG